MIDREITNPHYDPKFHAWIDQLEAEGLAMRLGRNVSDYPTELTPAGEQLCIPGTERQPVAGNRQLNLFGG
jgi:hypothetical protein